MITWQTKKFAALTLDELYGLLKLRIDVFVVEQNCLYPDLDDKDQRALHLLGQENDQVVAYARLFAPDDYFKSHVSFGRVATAQSIRGQGIGCDLVKQAIAACQSAWPGQTIEISGQYYLKKFYLSLGFQAHGDLYLEANIEHMRFLL